MVVLGLCCAILFICFGTTVGQVVRTTQWVAPTSNRGPIVSVACAGLGDSATYVWEFANKTLAIDGRLIDADRSRHSVRKGDIENIGYGSLLQITNALKKDAGNYTCTATTSGGQGSTYSDTITVIIDQYLPPVTYPECNIYPSETLTENSNATFQCIPGESYPPVKLSLVLLKQDGTTEELGDGNITRITRTVSRSDNNATFVCTMTSDTFLTAPQRICSAGPMTVLLPQTTTRAIGSSSANNMEASSKVQPYVWGIIGGIVGAVITLASFIIVIIFILKHASTSKPSHENVAMTTSSNHQAPSSADHTYMAYRKDSEQEPYMELDHTKQESNSVAKSSNPDYQNMHKYENSMQIGHNL